MSAAVSTSAAAIPGATTAARLRIGVIVTCYNYARYVGYAIDSVRAQARPADELIVVDDGSTDGSRDIISRYGAAVRPIFQVNAGQVAARNAGFAASTADVVLFLDADDALLPDALAQIERHWSADAAKLQFDLELIGAAGEGLNRRCCTFPAGYDAAAIAAEFLRTGTYRWPVTSGNVYARRLIEPLMPMQPPQSQDGVLNTIAPLYGRVISLSQPLGQYRLHGSNASRARVTARAALPHFSRRIAIRHAELDVLRQHAAALGVSLPGDPLDHEIVFVNYRLMARKLRECYVHSERDSTPHLWWRGIRLAWNGAHPLTARMAHSLWFCVLALCPTALAPLLTELRFDRSNVRARVHHWWRGRFGSGVRGETPR
ncbi:MAG: glycosyltransferase family A protein [Steroidobacteraceae bacterium]